MSEPVALPAMSAAQQQSWHALMDVYQRLPEGWTLIGGQLVHLHCAERKVSPPRPTNDVDTVVDVRAAPDILARFTAELSRLGFVPATSGDGIQHRWKRDEAQIDVLIPEGIGERATKRHGVGGAPSVPAPGTTQALRRSATVAIVVDGRAGHVRRPHLISALIGKAAARGEIAADQASGRHCVDFVILAGLAAAQDFREIELTNKDRQRLRRMLGYCRDSSEAMVIDGARDSLERLQRAARL